MAAPIPSCPTCLALPACPTYRVRLCLHGGRAHAARVLPPPYLLHVLAPSAAQAGRETCRFQGGFNGGGGHASLQGRQATACRADWLGGHCPHAQTRGWHVSRVPTPCSPRDRGWRMEQQHGMQRAWRLCLLCAHSAGRQPDAQAVCQSLQAVLQCLHLTAIALHPLRQLLLGVCR